MMQDVPMAKVLGMGVFEVGCVTLAWSIYSLIPREGMYMLDASAMTSLMVNMLTLAVAAILISTGMFFVVYGEDLFD